MPCRNWYGFLNNGTTDNGGVLTTHVASATTVTICGTVHIWSNTTTGWVSNIFYAMSLDKRSISLKMEIPIN